LFVSIFALCFLSAASLQRQPSVGDAVAFMYLDPETSHVATRSGYTLSVSPSSGPIGTIMTISYSGPTVSATWIGVFPAGSYSTSLFQYVSTASGTIQFHTSGLTAGSYVIYYTYNSLIQASATYTVTGSSTTSTSTTGTTGTTATSGSTTGGGNSATWLASHNTRRSAYGSPALSWSANLAAGAQNWANKMASQCSMYHSGTSGVGENIAYGYTSIDAVLQAWANSEAANYNPSTKQCKPGTVCGHFTQVMWKSTTLVGCGIAYCGSSAYYCCQYIRPGNCNNYDYTQSNSPCPHFDDNYSNI